MANVSLRVSAWGAIALGVVHCLSTPVVLMTDFGKLPGPDLATFLFMFIGTGFSLAIAGVAMLRLAPLLLDGRPESIFFHRLGAAYLGGLGAGAVVAMADNPFAWLMLADGVVALASLRGAPSAPVCRRVSLPESSLLAADAARYHYADSYVVELDREVSVDEAVNAFCGPLPAPVRILLGVRDAVVGAIGLKTAPTYLAGDPRDPIVRHPGERLGLFQVRERCGHEIVLGEDDSHLDFRVSVLVEERRVFVSTVVVCNNLLGRIYFAVVKPIHKRILAWTLPRNFRPLLRAGAR